MWKPIQLEARYLVSLCCDKLQYNIDPTGYRHQVVESDVIIWHLVETPIVKNTMVSPSIMWRQRALRQVVAVGGRH